MLISGDSLCHMPLLRYSTGQQLRPRSVAETDTASTTMNARAIKLGDPWVWARLELRFRLLQLNLQFMPEDLAELSLEDIRSKIKKILPSLKDIHHLISLQASSQESLVQAYTEINDPIQKMDKAKARFLLSLEVSRAQLAGDDEQEKHWQQLLDDSWKGEVPPILTREYLLSLRDTLQDWRGMWANSPLLLCPDVPRRMEANAANIYAWFSEQLRIAELEAQGLKVDKNSKAAINVRYAAAIVELSDTTIEGFDYLKQAIMLSETRLQEMQENVEFRDAEYASFAAHIYKRTHARVWRRWTPWWKQRHGLRMPDWFARGSIAPHSFQSRHREAERNSGFERSSMFSGMSNATTLIEI